MVLSMAGLLAYVAWEGKETVFREFGCSQQDIAGTVQPMKLPVSWAPHAEIMLFDFRNTSVCLILVVLWKMKGFQ